MEKTEVIMLWKSKRTERNDLKYEWCDKNLTEVIFLKPRERD